MRVAGYGALLLALSVMTACGTDPKPVYQDEPNAHPVIEHFDGTLDPSKAVLPLVPADATELKLTDFTQLRLSLGFGEFDSSSAAQDRNRFWHELPQTAALSDGLLHPVDDQLRSRFGFGADDVAWEASYDGGGTNGWILSFRDDMTMGGVTRAVKAGVGPLKGAVVDAQDHLVTSAAPPSGDESWGHDPDLVALVGRPADSTYVSRECAPFATVFGKDVQGQLTGGAKDMMEELDPLDGYAISFGSQLATAVLGPNREDLFARMRLSGVLPATKPDFGLAFARGVADPSSGRIGYELGNTQDALRLTTEHRLPFAVCTF